MSIPEAPDDLVPDSLAPGSLAPGTLAPANPALGSPTPDRPPSGRLAPDSLAEDSHPDVLKRRSVRGAAVTFAAQGLRAGLQLGSQIALAHLLLPAAFGLVAMIGPVVNLVQIFNELGLTQATVQKPQITHDELTTLFWINIAISAALAALMMLSSPLVAWFYGEPRLVGLTLCFGGLLLLSGISAQQIALMNRRMRFTRLAAIDVSCMVAASVVGLAAAALGLGYWSLVLMQGANSLAIVVLAWVLSDWRPSWPTRRSDVGQLLRFGGRLTSFNILGYAESSLGPILIGRLNGAVALGLYDRAFKLVIVPWWQINLPVSRVAIALLARLRPTEHLFVRAHRRMFEGLLLISAPGLVWAALSSTALTPLVLGPEWRDAAPIVAWLALATTTMPFGAAAYWLFVSEDRVREQLRYGLFGGVLLVVALLIGIHWGSIGVARAYACSTAIVQLTSLWGATRRGPVRLSGIVRATMPIGGALILSGLAVLLTTRLGAALPVELRLGLGLTLSYLVCAVGLSCLPGGARILRDTWELRTTLRGAPAPS